MFRNESRCVCYPIVASCGAPKQWKLLPHNDHHLVMLCLLCGTSHLYQHVEIAGTVYPKKYAHSFCFAVLCCGYTLTDFPISIRLTSLALWQSNDCPSASKATLMNMDKYFMWIHYEQLHNHNKAKHKKNVCIFLGIYCKSTLPQQNIFITNLQLLLTVVLLLMTPIICGISHKQCQCFTWRVWWQALGFLAHDITWCQAYVA